MRRFAPRVVFVEVGLATDFERKWLERELGDGGPPTIVTDGDDPALADVRCLHGLVVLLSPRTGYNGGLLQWFDAIVDVQPSRVVVLMGDGECFEWPG